MITDLRLQNFRSYDDESFEISPSVNIIVGPNGSGKTNLLEAVLVIALGHSYRARDIELVQFNKPWARIDAHLSNSSVRTVKITPETLPTKTYELEGKNYQRLTRERSLPVVLFEPNHLRLLAGGPERRREYLDDLLEQTREDYGPLRRKYKRALAQRNALLKNQGKNRAEIFPWNVRLSELGGQIVQSRDSLIKDIATDTCELYKELATSNITINLEYLTQWPVDNYESHLLKALDTNFEKDQLRGFTTSGPHRDDLNVLFKDIPAQIVASRGEMRTVVLALKIMELKLNETLNNKAPLLLLDDVFSELDGQRRHALTSYLAHYQTFITTTDADLGTKQFIQGSSIILLN